MGCRLLICTLFLAIGIVVPMCKAEVKIEGKITVSGIEITPQQYKEFVGLAYILKILSDGAKRIEVQGEELIKMPNSGEKFAKAASISGACNYHQILRNQIFAHNYFKTCNLAFKAAGFSAEQFRTVLKAVQDDIASVADKQLQQASV